MSEERIQRILARAGIASRRKAEELIREARVTVNGQVAGIGDKADPAKDAIKVDGKRVHPHEGPYRYLLLNKPRGVMSTVADPQERKTVMDFVPPALRKALVPVGRLDFDSEGLILLTDDGDFAQHVAHPRYGGSKTYEVKVKGEPSEGMLDRLREGIVLEGERTAPARIVRRVKGPQRRRGGDASRARDDEEGHNSWWVVELTQGRTRQIREMFLRIGHPVQKLRRVAIGPLRDPHLPTGAVRELSEREVETLRRITARPKKKKEPGEKAAAKKAAPGKRAAPAKKRAPAKKPLSVKRAAQGEPPKAAKKAPARKAGVKRAPAKKTSAKKAPAKRSPAQRSPAKKGGAGGGGRRTSGAPRGRRP